jgi:hypothetical protein
MKFYGRAKSVADKLVEKFEKGEVADALATVFINKKEGEAPMWQWSTTNVLMCLFAGHTDSRGFRQWGQVGRKVIKGSKANAYILIPLFFQKEDENATRKILYGFKSQAVFDITQTEISDAAKWEAHTGETESERERETQFLNNLPLVEVAHKWGMKLDTYKGSKGKAHAFYSPGQNRIAMGVEDAQTFLHELIHKADDMNGNLKPFEAKFSAETVAEFGALVLAKMIGLESADEGGTYRYVKAYCEAANVDMFKAIQKFMERTIQAVNIILETADDVEELVTA